MSYIQNIPSVLVVEDDPDIAEILRATLKEDHHLVKCAYDAPEALDVLNGNPPDIVLLDCHLPGGGMSEILARANQVGSKVVLMSGDSALLMQLSAFGYPCLHKPFRLSALMAVTA